MRVIFEGGNYVLAEDAEFLWVRVWRRTDLNMMGGARLAEDLSVKLKEMSADSYKGLVFDFRSAPPAWGARTEKALLSAFGEWAVLGKPVVFIATSAMQTMTLQRHSSNVRSGVRTIVNTDEEAKAWAQDWGERH